MWHHGGDWYRKKVIAAEALGGLHRRRAASRGGAHGAHVRREQAWPLVWWYRRLDARRSAALSTKPIMPT